MTGQDATTQDLTDAALIGRIENQLAAFLDNRKLPASLLDAIRYALLGGGKRVRPVICLRSCLVVGGAVDAALAAAGAVELIHAFSLVHDDLPAMDDDDLRRGRPTLHRHTSEAMAILAGDSMTVLAFELLAEGPVEADTVVALVGELARATNAMVAGQVYDTMLAHPPSMTEIDKLRLTHRNKTGALIGASARMGAISGGGGQAQLTALTQYADAIGLMFQAVDDLLDATQSTEAVGKQTRKDVEAGKLTYPSLLGIQGTRAEVQNLLDQALEALSDFDDRARPLRGLAQKLAIRTR
ncbi:MAG: polyprenyl synthetase family protein [Planctomycetota bacterium]